MGKCYKCDPQSAVDTITILDMLEALGDDPHVLDEDEIRDITNEYFGITLPLHYAEEVYWHLHPDQDPRFK
jgi:hypothetical protein